MSRSNIVKTILVLAFVPIVLAAQNGRGNVAAERQKAVETAVLETHAQIVEAEKSLDAERFFELIPNFDKGLIIQDGTLFETRQEALDTVRAGFRGVDKVDRTYEQKYVTVLSPEAAVLTAEGTTSATLSDGRTFSSRFAASMIFVLRDGQWKLLHGHYSAPNPR